MTVKFYSLGEISNEQFHFAVICAAYKGKWIFVKHKDRTTWEIPGGHREENEAVQDAAARELFEETGAAKYQMEPVCDYSVTVGERTSWGRVFYAKVTEMGSLPESEISEVRFAKKMPDNLTYPEIQPLLMQKVLQHLTSKTLRLLEKDKARNINIINFMKNYPVQTCYTVGESVLVRAKSDTDWVYISSKSEEEFTQLIESLDDEDKCFAVLEDWMLPFIVRNRGIVSQLTCMKLVYDGTIPLPPVVYDVVDLSPAVALYVFENSKYQEFLNIEYIEERINNGFALGIYEDGKLVAWAITHDDGAIGFLHVLEAYRGRGYGLNVTSAMIERLLNQGELPFVHIEESNIKSMNLALKAGFQKDRLVHWITLK